MLAPPSLTQVWNTNNGMLRRNEQFADCMLIREELRGLVIGRYSADCRLSETTRAVVSMVTMCPSRKK